MFIYISYVYLGAMRYEIFDFKSQKLPDFVERDIGNWQAWVMFS